MFRPSDSGTICNHYSVMLEERKGVSH